MPIRLQSDSEAASKQSTFYLGKSASGLWSELATDLSHYFDNFTAGAGNASEDIPGSQRFNVSDPRTIGAVVEIDNADSGSIFQHSTGSTLLRFDVSPAGTLRATSNNTVVGSLTIPGLSGSASQYVLAWASRANPLTTGAGDAVQSWLYAIDVAGGEVARAEFFHAVKNPGLLATSRWGGLSGTFTGVWFAGACQSLTEIARDWGVTSETAPSTDCDLDLPPLPFTLAMGLGDESQIYGPVPQWAAVHVKHAMRRTWSPLANKVFLSQPTLQSTTGVSSAAYRFAPGSTAYRMNRGWIHPAPVPPGVTHAWVRLNVRSWVTSGDPVPLGVRVYSMSKLPDKPGGALVVRQVGEVITRDDTSSGDGGWDINAIVELAVGDDGWTYLCPAFAINPGGDPEDGGNARAQIRALHVVPCFPE